MGLFSFTGGFVNAIDGYNQQTQLNIDRANADEDRQYARTQRAYQANLQQHQTDALAREDQRRTADQAIPQVGTQIDGVTPAADGGPDDVTDPSSVNAQNGNDVGGSTMAPTPAPQTFTDDERYRALAKNAQAAGDTTAALQYGAAADASAFNRSAQMFQQVRANAAGKTPLQIAQEAQSIYNSDPMPINVSNIQPTQDGGVSVTLTNKNNGQAFQKQFSTSDELLKALEAHFSPGTFAAYQQAQMKATMKVQEEQAVQAAKPVITPYGAKTRLPNGQIIDNPRNINVAPGGMVVRPDGTQYVNPKTFPPGKAADPNPELSAAQKQFDFTSTKLSDKLPPDQASAGRALLQPLMDSYKAKTGQVLPPSAAVDVATRAVMHPEQIKAEIDPSTGGFVSTINDSQGNQFLLPMKPQIDPKTNLPVGLTPADAKAKVGDMLGSLGAAAPAYTGAAFDKTGAARSALITQTRAAIQQQYSQNPTFAKASKDEQQAILTQAFQRADQLVNNRLLLVSTFGDAPTTPKPARLQKPGGFGSGSNEMFSGDDAWKSVGQL